MARVLLMLCLFVVSTWIKPIVSVPNVQNVSVAARSETELTLKWYKDNSNYRYILSWKDESIQFSYEIDSDEGDVVTHTVSSLSPGTEYTFTIYTVLEDKQSSGYNYTTVTSPPDIEYVYTSQSDKYIDLYWHNYDSKYDYVLKFENSEIFISGYSGFMRHNISSLSPLTEYDFTLFTVFKNVRSRGYNFTIVTDPANVYNVSVSDRTENEVTLEWSKVHNISSYVLRFDGMEMFINGSDNVSVVRHTVSSLSPGRIYYYLLHTVFDTRQSNGYYSYAVTVPVNVDNVTVQHQDDANIVLKFSDTNALYRNRHYYILKYGEIETYIGIHDDFMYNPYLDHYYDHYEDTYTVKSLSPGTKYNFTLYSVLDGIRSRGYNISAETTLAKVTDLHCEYSWSGSVVNLVWVAPDGLWSEFEVQVNEEIPKHVNITRYQIDDVLSSVQYKISVTSLSGKLRSDTVSVVCQTNTSDPANVYNVSVSDRTENEVTLEWSKVHNISSYVLRFDGMEMFINGSDNVSVVRHTVSSLSPGRIYYYSLYTLFDTRQSNGYYSYAVTVPVNVDNVTVQHQDDANIVLKFSDTNVFMRFMLYYILKYGEKETYIGVRNDVEYNPYLDHYYDHYEDTYTVKSLSPGTKYNFTLYSVLDGIRSRGYNFSAETTPAKVTGLHCEYSWSGSVVNLVWVAPDGLWSEFEVQVNEEIPKHVNITRYQIDDVLSSVQYKISVRSLSGKLRSDPVSIMCQTNTSGAIAGSMLSVFLVILLVSIGVFCIHKKLDLRRCFFGKGNVEKTSNLPIDLIYVNTSTHNTPENQDSSVKSENIDISGENNLYEVLH